MAIFKNIPSSKRAKKHGDKVLALSQELKNIIISHNCVDFQKINVNSLDYALFMYDMDFYRQVMSIKYSSFIIEFTIRTIFITMESNIKKAGNIIEENYFFSTFVKLSNTFHKIYDIAKEEHMNEFVAVATYLCSNELQMTDLEISNNENLVSDIAKHFDRIINLPYEEI